MTNPRLREELGMLSLTPKARWVSGPGTTPVMAVFTHVDPAGSRFADGTFAAFYAGREVATAIRETVHHRERFLARTNEPAMRIEMRCYTVPVERTFHDIRNGYPQLHDPDDYTESRRFAAALRNSGSDGIVYRSVRHPGGECIAAFWPDCVGPCTQSKHYAYHWDGRRIAEIVELKAVDF